MTSKTSKASTFSSNTLVNQKFAYARSHMHTFPDLKYVPGNGTPTVPLSALCISMMLKEINRVYLAENVETPLASAFLLRLGNFSAAGSLQTTTYRGIWTSARPGHLSPNTVSDYGL